MVPTNIPTTKRESGQPNSSDQATRRPTLSHQCMARAGVVKYGGLQSGRLFVDGPHLSTHLLLTVST